MNERIRVTRSSRAGLLRAIGHQWAAVLQTWLPATCIVCGNADASALCTDCGRTLPGSAVPRCPRCGSVCASVVEDPVPASGMAAGGQGVCLACRLSPPAFERSIILADYAPPLDRVVQALKFGRDASLAAPLGRALAQRVLASLAEHPVHADGPLLVTAIPLTHRRLAERGFNQSLELARAMVRFMTRAAGPSARPALRLDHRLLARTRDSAPASTLHADERRRALQDGFRSDRALTGATVLLVDDVMTTGATLESAGRTLLGAGARSVINCVVARTRAPHSDAPGRSRPLASPIRS